MRQLILDDRYKVIYRIDYVFRLKGDCDWVANLFLTDLDNFDGVEDREGEGGEHNEERAQRYQQGTDARCLVTVSTKSGSPR